jgi:hypothetical protein
MPKIVSVSNKKLHMDLLFEFGIPAVDYPPEDLEGELEALL